MSAAVQSITGEYEVTATHAGPGLEPDVPTPEAECILPSYAEPLSVERQDHGREGERAPLVRSLAQLLDDPDALRPPVAIVPKLAWRGRLTLVSGREKQGGKSTLLTAGAAAVTRGGDFLEERCESGVVLWVTADQEHQGEIARRALRFGADPARLLVLWPQNPFNDLASVLLDLIPGIGTPVLIVIDTLASFARTLVTDPHSSADWPQVLIPLVQYARKLNLAVAVVHHAKKGEGGGYRDSTAIGALVDMLLEITPDTGNASRRNISALGRWPTPNFTVELTGDRYQLIGGGELSLDARVLAYVQAHPSCSKREIRDSIGGRREDVDVSVARLLSQSAVKNVGTKAQHAYVLAATAAVQPDLSSDFPTSEENENVPF